MPPTATPTDTASGPSVQDTATGLGIALIANVPTILWGLPGQGKSSVIEQLGIDYGFWVETVISSIREPSDFAGLPIVDDITKSVSLAPPSWAQRLADHCQDGKPGLTFYDEISTAPPATQAALLRPVLTGWVGDLQLPASVRTLGAANPADIAAGGWDLAPPMANRFLHLTWNLSADYVRDGFSFGWPKVVLPQVAPESVKPVFDQTMVLVGSFLGARPELVTRMPDSSDQSGMAFPTPRTWEQVAKLYATAKVAGCNAAVIDLLIRGSVGVAATGEFLTYVAHLDLPDPEVLLRDPSTLVVPSDRGDKVYAIAAAVWAATLSNLTPERWLACGEVLVKIADAGHADIAFRFARRWGTDRPEGVMPTQKMVASLGPILQELNLLR